MSYDVGIVILNYNSFDDAQACISSIKETTSINYHIYLVDNKSTDDSWEQMSAFYKHDEKITTIISPENNGYSAGNNIGAQKAIEDACKYLLFSNTDILYRKGAVDNLYFTLEKKSAESVAVCGPTIEEPNKAHGEYAINKFTFKSYFLTRKPLGLLIPKDRYEREQKITFDENGIFSFYGMVSGCSFLIRTEVFEEIGRFDEGLFLFGEEDILAYKLEEKNYQTMITRDANIFHNHRKTINKSGEAFSKYHHLLSMQYVQKNYANTNKLQSLMIAIPNILYWALKSVYKESYRIRLKAFIKESFCRIL